MAKMTGVVLPGNSTVEFREFDIPEPGHGQVLLKIKASSICGSDIRAIYREHLGKGPEAYQGVICGHEPCGQVDKLGWLSITSPGAACATIAAWDIRSVAPAPIAPLTAGSVTAEMPSTCLPKKRTWS